MCQSAVISGADPEFAIDSNSSFFSCVWLSICLARFEQVNRFGRLANRVQRLHQHLLLEPLLRPVRLGAFKLVTLFSMFCIDGLISVSPHTASGLDFVGEYGLRHVLPTRVAILWTVPV